MGKIAFAIFSILGFVMSILTNIEGKRFIKFIEHYGYKFKRQKGSHLRYKNHHGISITIPASGKRVIKPGIVKGLLNEMNLTSISLANFFNTRSNI